MSRIKYTQLCYAERIVIENRLRNGESYNTIAKAIGRSESTISREVMGFVREQIKRLPGKTRDKLHKRVNRPYIAKLDGRHYRGRAFVCAIRQAKDDASSRQVLLCKIHNYRAIQAQQYAAERQSTATRSSRKLLCPEYGATLKYIQDKLALRWSPEQISLRINALLARPGLKDADGWSASMGLRPISHMTIYRYIYRLQGSQRTTAVSRLRRRGRVYRSIPRLPYRNTRQGKRSIHDRPAAIDNLERFGDLEGDTIFGKDAKDRLLTHTDRKSGLGSISLILGYNAASITVQTATDISRIFGQDNTKTITYDNGIEFSTWRSAEKAIQADIYFADPYKSSQRGRNENFNGLVRDFLPKGTDFKKLTPQRILDIENLLNTRPRKRLGGLTPLEVFMRSDVRLEC